jgi:hypothetical protein
MGSSFISTGSGWSSQMAKRAFSCHFVMSMKSGVPRESCHMSCDHSLSDRTYRRPPLFSCLLCPLSLFCNQCRQKRTQGTRWAQSSTPSQTELLATIANADAVAVAAAPRVSLLPAPLVTAPANDDIKIVLPPSPPPPAKTKRKRKRKKAAAAAAAQAAAQAEARRRRRR